MGRHRSWALAVLVFSAGCAFSSVDRTSVDKYRSTFSTSESLKANPGLATDASKSALEAIGYEVQSVTPELGLLRTRAREVSVPTTCDCGSWNGRDVSGVANSFLVVRVQPEGADKTSLRVEHSCAVNFTGRNLFGGVTRQETYECASRGVVERQFWDALRQTVAARAVREHPAGASAK